MALDPIGVIFTAKDAASATIEKLEGQFKSLDGVTEDVTKKFTKHIKTIGVGIAALGAGGLLLGGLNAASNKFNTLQTSVAEVSTLIQGTKEEIDTLTNASIQFSKTYGTDAVSQAKGYYQAISAGVGDVTQATAFMDVANKVAIGGVTDIGTAIDGLTTVTNAFVQQNVTASQAADALFIGMKAGKTTVGELSASISKAAPSAAALGINFNELIGAASALTTGGMKTEIAMTKLNAIFTAFLSKQDVAKEMGPQVAAAFSLQNLKAKGLGGALKDLDTALGGDQVKMQKVLGSAEALGAALSLTGAQADTFDKIMRDMQTGTGAAEEAFKKMTMTAEFQQKRFTALRESIVLMIGKAFNPIQAAVYRVASAFMEMVAAIPQPVIDFLVKIASYAGGVLVLTGSLLVLKGVFGILGLIAGKLFLAMLPLVAVIMAVSGAVFMFYQAFQKNIGGFGDWLAETFNDVKLFFTAIAQLISDGEISEALYMQLQEAGILDFVEIVMRGFYILKSFLGGVFDGFMEGIEIMSPFIEIMIGSFMSLANTIRSVFGLATNEIGMAGDSSEGFLSTLDMVRVVGQTVGATLGQVFGGIASIISGTVALINMIIEGFIQLIDLVKMFTADFSGTLKDAGGWIKELGGGALSKVGSFFGFGGDEGTVTQTPTIESPQTTQIQPSGIQLNTPTNGIEATALAAGANVNAVNRASETATAVAQEQAEKEKETIVVSRLVLDGRQVAETVNRVNKRQAVAAGGQL